MTDYKQKSTPKQKKSKKTLQLPPPPVWPYPLNEFILQSNCTIAAGGAFFQYTIHFQTFYIYAEVKKKSAALYKITNL